MLENLGIISASCLVILIVCNLFSLWISPDKSKIWSPIAFIDFVYIYYALIPYFTGSDYYGFNQPSYSYYAIIGAFLSYLACLITFYHFKRGVSFSNYNNVFTEKNGIKLALILFAIGFLGHAAFRGFSFSIFAKGDNYVWEKEGDFEFYFSNLVSLSCAACGLLLSLEKRKTILIPVLLVTLIIYIVAGFRYRIVILIITMAVCWQLYPKVKRINYKVLVPIAISSFLFFGLMDSARQYSAGLNKDVVANYDITKAKGAGENASVFIFSGYVIEAYQNREFVYFQPLWCAITLPIPRVLFPAKPNADYIKNISTSEYGGAAFTYYAEAYMAFGWIGLILYGLFLGWFAKRVWINYQKNSGNLNAILFLGLFDGFIYVFISRGYMAQALMTFLYFVVLPFWLGKLLKRVFLIKPK